MDVQLKRHLKLDTILESPNLVGKLDADDVKKIGMACAEGYKTDLASRQEWETRLAQGNKLALQIKEAKNLPWPGCANVKFPLITVAALQYQAKAYPELCPPEDLVKAKVYGPDPDGKKGQRAERIGNFMSWQNLEQDPNWEPDQDKGLLVQAIAGCFFRKRVWEPGPARQVTRLVLPQNLVINYFATSLDDAPRYTHTYYLTPNNIRQRELDGRFAKIEAKPAAAPLSEPEAARDDRQGVTPPQDDGATPYFTCEQYCWIDLDGDGYEEPYIVTFDAESSEVRRIVARFHEKDVKYRGNDIYRIDAVRMFTKYGFIPSPDGGFYDLGLGSLLGPICESVNTAINQMFDAGTMATLGGGFLGRGFKSKGGAITFQPNQWYPVDAPGDDLRKNILPLPAREPSDVLFRLLGFLVEYGERIVSATDIQMGENVGQNTPAETTRTLNENGARVYNAIYKRTWRAERDEFRIQYDLNAIYLREEDAAAAMQEGGFILPGDFVPGDAMVRPVADPHIVSDSQRIAKAQVVFQNAQSVPGHNRYQATLRLYKALRVPNIPEVLPPPMQPGPPGPDGKPQMVPAQDYPPPPNPKLMQLQLEQQDFQFEVKKWLAERQDARIELQMEVGRNQAEIMKLYAQAEKALAEAKGVDTGHQIALIEAQIGALKTRNEGLLKAIEIIQKGVEKKEGNGERRDSGGGGAEPMAGLGIVPLAAPGVGQNLPGNGAAGPGFMG